MGGGGIRQTLSLFFLHFFATGNKGMGALEDGEERIKEGGRTVVKSFLFFSFRATRGISRRRVFRLLLQSSSSSRNAFLGFSVAQVSEEDRGQRREKSFLWLRLAMVHFWGRAQNGVFRSIQLCIGIAAFLSNLRGAPPSLGCCLSLVAAAVRV